MGSYNPLGFLGTGLPAQSPQGLLTPVQMPQPAQPQVAGLLSQPQNRISLTPQMIQQIMASMGPQRAPDSAMLPPDYDALQRAMWMQRIGGNMQGR